MDFLETSLGTCSFCAKNVKYPIKLPCQSIVCKIHIDILTKDNQKSKLNCPICNMNHKIPKEGFKTHHTLSNLVQQYKPNENESTKFFVKFERSMEWLSTLSEQVNLTKSKMEVFIYDKVKLLQNEIDLEREELKLKIDNEHNNLTNRLEAIHNFLNESLNAIHPLEDTRSSIEEINKKISKEKYSWKIDTRKIEEITMEIENETKKVIDKLKEYDEFRKSAKNICFDNYLLSQLAENLLGSLEMTSMQNEQIPNLITVDDTHLNILNPKTGIFSLY